MDADLLLTIGVVLGILTLPPFLSAWAEGAPPRMAIVMLIIALGLVGYAVSRTPGGYAFREVPDIMLEVFARFTR